MLLGLVSSSWKSWRLPNLQVSVVALLLGHGDVELVEGQSDALEVLLVLHPVDEVPADDVSLKAVKVVNFCQNLLPVLKVYDRNDSGQYYKTTITIVIDDPS